MIHNRSTKYNQKEIYTVIGGMVVDNADNKFEVQTAPNTWYVRAAINRGFQKWKLYRHKLLAETGLDPSKYADFKIYLNTAGSGVYRDPIAADRNPLSVSEWTFSSVENDTGAAKSFMIMGDHNSAKYGLMKGWIENKPLPLTSEPPMPDLNADSTLDYKVDFLNTLDGTNDNIGDQVEDAIEENDSVPYALTQAYGSDINNPNNLQVQCLTYTSAVNPSQMIPGFEAVCGLVNVIADAGNNETGPLLFLDVMSSGRKF